MGMHWEILKTIRRWKMGSMVERHKKTTWGEEWLEWDLRACKTRAADNPGCEKNSMGYRKTRLQKKVQLLRNKALLILSETE